MVRFILYFLAFLFSWPLLLTAQSGMAILEKSIMAHDPQGKWNSATLSVHIEEPRVGNPYRYSIVKLDNKTGYFEMQRNREAHVSTHIMDENDLAMSLLDGKLVTDSTLIKSYRLEPSRNERYKSYYEGFYGMPMNLPEKIEKIIESTEVVFNGKECYSIKIKLKEPLFSDQWRVYVAKADYFVLGLEMITDESKMEGERLYFDQFFEVDGMKLARMRHWHDIKDDVYLGSDIIVSNVE
jgi:hypothetical protein